MSATFILNAILFVAGLHCSPCTTVPCDSADNDSQIEYLRSKNAEGKAYYAAGEYRLAVDCFFELTDNGYPPGITNLGIAYLNGAGISQDSHRAFECFKAAAELGEPTAQIHLGTMYARGIGTEIDDSAAIYWFTQRAAEGDTKAMNSIGIIYLNGNDIEADSTTAYRWFRQSAINGDNDGMFYLGLTLVLSNPEYTDSILGSGRNCIYNAARKGHRQAQIYMMNEAVKHGNYTRAYNWSKTLHENGETEGTMILAYCYRYGRGVSRNRRQAKKLYSEAAAKGNEEAARILEEW